VLTADDYPTAFSLCLVSKMVHRWITPVLYRTVTLHLRQDYWSKHIPNPHLIRNLYLSCSMLDYVQGLQESTMLQYLVLDWHGDIYFPPGLAFASLTHLTINHDAFFVGRGILDHQLFPAVTHLCLLDFYWRAEPTNISAWPPSLLSNLTHVVWGWRSDLTFFTPHIALLSRFLKPLTTLDTVRVIGMHVLVRPMYGLNASQCREQLVSAVQSCVLPDYGRHKIAIMPVSKGFDVDQWRAWFRGGEDIWETAERLLSEQSFLMEHGDEGG
jgi:hypothetical protein